MCFTFAHWRSRAHLTRLSDPICFPCDLSFRGFVSLTRLHRSVWSTYADELVRARDYGEARSACERVVQIADESEARAPQNQMIAVSARIHLALIYQELGTEPAEQRKLVEH